MVWGNSNQSHLPFCLLYCFCTTLPSPSAMPSPWVTWEGSLSQVPYKRGPHSPYMGPNHRSCLHAGNELAVHSQDGIVGRNHDQCQIRWLEELCSNSIYSWRCPKWLYWKVWLFHCVTYKEEKSLSTLKLQNIILDEQTSWDWLFQIFSRSSISHVGINFNKNRFQRFAYGNIQRFLYF